MANITIASFKGGKKMDTYYVLDLPALREFIRNGHPTDTADMLLYFFLRQELGEDPPDGSVGVSYALFEGRKKLLDANTKGVLNTLLVLDPLIGRRACEKLAS